MRKGRVATGLRAARGVRRRAGRRVEGRVGPMGAPARGGNGEKRDGAERGGRWDDVAKVSKRESLARASAWCSMSQQQPIQGLS